MDGAGRNLENEFDTEPSDSVFYLGGFFKETSIVVIIVDN